MRAHFAETDAEGRETFQSLWLRYSKDARADAAIR